MHNFEKMPSVPDQPTTMEIFCGNTYNNTQYIAIQI